MSEFSAPVSLDLARSLLQQQRWSDAERVLRILVSRDSVEAGVLLGQRLFASGAKAEAIKVLQAAVARERTNAPAQLFLGMALKDTGNIAAAIPWLRSAAARLSHDPLAQTQYGIVCQETGDLKHAIPAFKAALASNVNYMPALERLGMCYLMRRQPKNALLCFQHYLTLAPGAAAAHYGYGAVLTQLGAHAEAVAEFRQAGSYPGARVALAGALHTAGHSAEACQIYREICRSEPENLRAILCLGNTFRALGQLDRAQQAYLRAITLQPNAPASYRRLLSLGEKYPLPPAQKAMLRSLADRQESLSPADKCELNFALYRFYASEKQEDAAIRALLSANAAKRASMQYDESAELKKMQEIMVATPASAMVCRSGFGDTSDLPVFIVGMPRSGTSLLEQILASHPDVFGAGEISDFSRALAKVSGHGDVVDLAALSGGQMQAVARDYLDRLHSYAPEAKRVVDKLPWNFRLLGYIHKLLPGAHILHIHRNPMDTCFSCFEQDFHGALPFSYSQEELGRYYRAYEAMMAHWRSVLPSEAFLDIDYKFMVVNFEAEVRRILEYCGLPWNPVCLKFFETVRPVRTASAVQVRRPVYQGADNRWMSYAAALAPLRNILAG